MSRSLGKIIDIIKAEKEISESDHNSSAWENVNDSWDLKRFLQKYDNLSRTQYLDLLAGGKIGSDWQSYAKDITNRYPHLNTPELNGLALKKLKEKKESLDPAEKSRAIDNVNNHISTIHEFMKLSNKDMSDAVEEGSPRVIHNPDFKKEHLYKMAQNHPQNMNAYIHSEHFDDRLAEMVFTNKESLQSLTNRDIRDLMVKKMKGYDGQGNPRGDDGQFLDVSPRILQAILEHAPDKTDDQTLNVMLDHVDPTFKKKFTDKALGITDGEYDHTTPDEYDNDEDFQADNWDNWVDNSFNPELNRVKNYLIRSRHIDDEQAEHIKRHGEFEHKYDLYHNKHIDPRHGAEMFQKWHDDQSDHGYEAQDLTDKFREDKDDIFTKDDLSEEVLEELREEAYNDGGDYEYAERNYDFDEYVRDHSHEIAKDIELSDEHYDDLYDKIRNDHDDWTAENPNAVQNEGKPVYDALNKLHENFDDEHITLDELKQTTGYDNWEALELEPDSDGEVHTDNIREELDRYGGPLMIDFSDSEDYSLQDHPEYEEREADAIDNFKEEILRDRPYDFYDQFYEGYHESDGFREQVDEYINEYIEENMGDHLDELYEVSHQNPRFIPEHLHTSIPNFHELNANERAKSLDGGHRDFLNNRVKDRTYEHEYGDGQHHHEMVVDHAIANGGAIDVGTMNKLYPNQKDTWKKIFAGKGKITSFEAQQKLDELPKTRYEISYGKWGSGSMQNVNSQDQILFRLDHSDDSIKPLMEDSGLYETFKKVQKVSKQSGHPTRDNTIAWARVDASDPNHWMIDEVQSDFGKTVTRYLKQEGAEDKASHVEAISDHHKNWREALINKVLKEAKKHGAEKVSTHSPESKHAHAAYGSSNIHSVYKDSYKKVPRQMGFKPVEHTELPLTDKGREYFHKENPYKSSAIENHTEAYTHHMEMAQAHNKLFGSGNIDENTRHRINEKGHLETAQDHLDRIKQYNPKFNEEDHKPLSIRDDAMYSARHMASENDFSSHEHDKLLKEPAQEFKDASNQGHTYNLTPKLLKKHMDYCLSLLEQLETLEKGEGYNAIKGAALALGLGIGAHYMGQDAKQEAAQKFTQDNTPKHARSVANIEPEQDVRDVAYEEAKKEANDIIARNDKKWFLKNHDEGLSPHVYKQTIKQNPELSNKYNYINSLSNSTFKEVIQKNPHLRNDVHGAHYDKLHGEFGGDHEKMSHAWKNGIKGTHAKFGTREPASVDETQLGEQSTQDTIDDTVKEAPQEPNFTARRGFRTHK